MRRASILVACLAIVVSSAAPAHAGLDAFMADLNVRARGDMRDFSLKLAAQFGVGDAEVQAILGATSSPADAFMCLQLGQMAHRPSGVVLEAMTAEKGKGWGVIAQRLGIKPGSAEFKALKRGNFALTGKPHGPGDKGKGKGHKK
jgi:hypothetical protein